MRDFDIEGGMRMGRNAAMYEPSARGRERG
jgi:hypothetical protein